MKMIYRSFLAALVAVVSAIALPQTKISELPAVTPPLTGTEIFPATQGTTTYGITSSDLKSYILSNVAFGSPTAKVGFTAVPGTASTYMRSDAAPALDLTISPTLTGKWTFTPAVGNNVTFQSNPNGGVALFAKGASQATGLTVEGVATSGASFGLAVQAGTNSNDYNTLWSNASNAQIMKLFGDGGLTVGAPTGGDCGPGCVNATSFKLNGGDFGIGLQSLALAMPSYFSVSGSPCNTAGCEISVNGATLSPNLVLASPNGASGPLSARALVAADIAPLAVTWGSTQTFNGGISASSVNVSGTVNVTGNLAAGALDSLNLVSPSGTIATQTVAANGSIRASGANIPITGTSNGGSGLGSLPGWGPGLAIWTPTGTPNQNVWELGEGTGAGTGDLQLISYDDTPNFGKVAMNITRSGTKIVGFQIGNLSDYPAIDLQGNANIAFDGSTGISFSPSNWPTSGWNPDGQQWISLAGSTAMRTAGQTFSTGDARMMALALSSFGKPILRAMPGFTIETNGGGMTLDGVVTVPNGAVSTPSNGSSALTVQNPGTQNTSGIKIQGANQFTPDVFDINITRTNTVAGFSGKGPNIQFLDQGVNDWALLEFGGGHLQVYTSTLGGEAPAWTLDQAGNMNAHTKVEAPSVNATSSLTVNGVPIQQLPLPKVSYTGSSTEGAFNVNSSTNCGEFIEALSGLIAIAANSLPIGCTFTIDVEGGQTVTLEASSGTLYWANGTTATGNRTVKGEAIVTVIITDAGAAKITGSGIS